MRKENCKNKYFPGRHSECQGGYECQSSSFGGSWECFRPKHVSAQNIFVIFLYFTNTLFVYLLIFKRRNYCWAMPKEKKITGIRSDPKLPITLR